MRVMHVNEAHGLVAWRFVQYRWQFPSISKLECRPRLSSKTNALIERSKIQIARLNSQILSAERVKFEHLEGTEKLLILLPRLWIP